MGWRFTGPRSIIKNDRQVTLINRRRHLYYMAPQKQYRKTTISDDRSLNDSDHTYSERAIGDLMTPLLASLEKKNGKNGPPVIFFSFYILMVGRLVKCCPFVIWWTCPLPQTLSRISEWIDAKVAEPWHSNWAERSTTKGFFFFANRKEKSSCSSI